MSSIMAYTSLISSDAFSGIQTDLGTAAAGIVTCLFVVLGLGILARVLS